MIIMRFDQLLNTAAVVSACQRGARVAWVDDNAPEGVGYGTARCVCTDESGAFPAADADPATLLVRVTTVGGWERFRPLPELAEQYATGKFVLDYTP